MNHWHEPARTAADDSLGPRVLALRKKLGITQAEMGKMIGVEGQTIRVWEKGRRAPTRKPGWRYAIRSRIKELEALAEQMKPGDPSFTLKVEKRKLIDLTDL